MNPCKPRETDPFAEAFLALKHYVDYRTTSDVDAWWSSRADDAALASAREAFSATASSFGYATKERSWRETVSLKAFDDDRKAFSFQIAVRTIQLGEPVPSPWGRFRIETLEDTVASKTLALVARGAPRDFTGVKAVVDAGLLSKEDYWSLWADNCPELSVDDGKQRVRVHIERIAARMPLDRLPKDQRDNARELRAWYRDAFTRPLEIRLSCDETQRRFGAIAMIDHSVYPDMDHGDMFADAFDRADYVQRICAACDFGVFPERATIDLFRGLRDVFDEFPIPDPPAYHAMRGICGWPAVELVPSLLPAPWEAIDRTEEREDPCRLMA